MSDDATDKVELRLLDTWMASTTALSGLNSAVTSLNQEFAGVRREAREHANGVLAKIDNLDRSLDEMRATALTSETARQAELKRIYDLLAEERNDRRAAVMDGRSGERAVVQSERELLREMVHEELSVRRSERAEDRNMLKSASVEIWRVGGKYIVAATVLLILTAVMQMTGVNLADVLGLARK